MTGGEKQQGIVRLFVDIIENFIRISIRMLKEVSAPIHQFPEFPFHSWKNEISDGLKAEGAFLQA
jgi:hypothetical protein